MEDYKKLVDLLRWTGRGRTETSLYNQSADAIENLLKELHEAKSELAKYREAEQDGRLVVLPQKTVWELTMDAGPDCDMKCPVDAWDESLGCDLCSKAKQFAYERPCTQGLLKELGKTVFLTREEAEAALALKGGEG